MKKTTLIGTVFSVFLAVILLFSFIIRDTGSDHRKEIVIMTSAEDYRITYMEQRMKEQFPQYRITFEYKGSGNHAAYLKASGVYADCHITYNLEYGYLAQLDALGYLADLQEEFDYSVYTEDAVTSNCYLPQERNGGAIIVNTDVIEERGLDVPTCYEDLLDPQYKGLISMPNPASSGTGYMFLLALVNEWGEEKAFDYFDKLSQNVLSFTSSGSGPVNALVSREVAIGLGMTAIAVSNINAGVNLAILNFEEGAPYSLYGQGIIKGNEDDPDVMEVFRFLATTLTEENNELYFPEKIFNEKSPYVENYPTNIQYADMRDNTLERKDALLKKWKY